MVKGQFFIENAWALEPYADGYAVLICQGFLGWVFVRRETLAPILFQ